MISPTARKLLLTVHVLASVGWLGAVGAFLAVAIAGVASEEALAARAAVVSLEWIGWYAIVPLAVVSALSGIVEGLLTSWGLWRYYWVIVKTAITIAAMGLLVLHMPPISSAAGLAAGDELSATDLATVNQQFAVQAGAAAVALTVVVALSIYKPKGLTAYGHRRLAAPAAPVDR